MRTNAPPRTYFRPEIEIVTPSGSASRNASRASAVKGDAGASSESGASSSSSSSLRAAFLLTFATRLRAGASSSFADASSSSDFPFFICFLLLLFVGNDHLPDRPRHAAVSFAPIPAPAIVVARHAVRGRVEHATIGERPCEVRRIFAHGARLRKGDVCDYRERPASLAVVRLAIDPVALKPVRPVGRAALAVHDIETRLKVLRERVRGQRVRVDITRRLVVSYHSGMCLVDIDHAAERDALHADAELSLYVAPRYGTGRG